MVEFKSTTEDSWKDELYEADREKEWKDTLGTSMKYEVEYETIKKIHITNHGFVWYYEICDDPDFPGDNVIIKQVEDGAILAKIVIPKDLIDGFINSLHEYKGDC